MIPCWRIQATPDQEEGNMEVGHLKSKFRFTSGMSEERKWSITLPVLTNLKKLKKGTLLLQYKPHKDVAKRAREADKTAAAKRAKCS